VDWPAVSNAALWGSNASQAALGAATFGSNTAAYARSTADATSNDFEGFVTAQTASNEAFVNAVQAFVNADEALSAQAAFGSNAAAYASNVMLRKDEYDAAEADQSAAFSNAYGYASNLANALQETVDDVLGPAITGLTGQVADVTANLATTAAQLVTTVATTVALGTAVDAAQSTADWSCNVAYDISQQVASVVEPKAVWASNQSSSATATAAWGSNAVADLGASLVDLQATAQFGSNTAADALGLAVQSSNLSGGASNQAGQLLAWLTESNYLPSNAYVAPSNAAALYGSNTGTYCSNALPSYQLKSGYEGFSNATTSNLAAIEDDFQELLTQLDVTFDVVDSNTAFASNAATFASNQVVAVAPAAAFGSNTAQAAMEASQWSCNLSLSTSNSLHPLVSSAQATAGWTSNQLPSYLLASSYVTPSNALAVQTSNDLYPRTAWSSNEIIAAQNAAVTQSNDFGARIAWASNALPNYATNAQVTTVGSIAVAASNQAFSNASGGGTASVSVPWWGSNMDAAIAVSSNVQESSIVQRTRRVRAGGYVDERAGFASNLVLYPPTSDSTTSSVQMRNPGLDRVVADFRADGTTTLSNVVITGTIWPAYPTFTASPWTLVQRVTASNTTTDVIFTSLTQRPYMLVVERARPAVNGGFFYMQVSTNNGVSFINANYQGQSRLMQNTAGSTAFVENGATWGFLLSGSTSNVVDNLCGSVSLYNVNSTDYMLAGGEVIYGGNTPCTRAFVNGMYLGTGVNAFNARWNNGAYAQGIVSLYALQ
jgi:hypothetical protein